MGFFKEFCTKNLSMNKAPVIKPGPCSLKWYCKITNVSDLLFYVLSSVPYCCGFTFTSNPGPSVTA
jgi:hypothetical protein